MPFASLRKPGETFTLSKTWHLPLLMVRGTYTLLLQFHRPSEGKTNPTSSSRASRRWDFGSVPSDIARIRGSVCSGSHWPWHHAAGLAKRTLMTSRMCLLATAQLFLDRSFSLSGRNTDRPGQGSETGMRYIYIYEEDKSLIPQPQTNATALVVHCTPRCCLKWSKSILSSIFLREPFVSRKWMR